MDKAKSNAAEHRKNKENGFYVHTHVMNRVRPIYRFADIFGRYRNRYIGIGKLDIGIGPIVIDNGIGYSGYQLYRYRQNIC